MFTPHLLFQFGDYKFPYSPKESSHPHKTHKLQAGASGFNFWHQYYTLHMHQNFSSY